MVLTGADDRVIPVASGRTIAAAPPEAGHPEVPAAGNMAMLERPGIVNDALRALAGRARRYTKVGQQA